jgi:hypothetical protein
MLVVGRLQEYYKLLQISAHYNVQLGVLAALQMFL